MTTLTQVEPFVATTPTSSTPVVNPVRRGPIMLALRGPTSSPAAISSAHILSTRLDLDVEVVTVIPVEPAYPSPWDITPETERTAHARHEEYKDEIRSAIRQAAADTDWPISVRSGHAAREVALAAKAVDASMIIVNSKPSTGPLRTMASVFATEVARRSTCPVLAVSAPLTELPRSIVAAVDFSPASIRAVQAALLVADTHASLSLVHVPVPVRFAQPHVDQTGAIVGADVANLFDRLAAELRPYVPKTISVRSVIAEGQAPAAILEHGRRESADLLVAGTHGPNRLERFFVGSTAVSLLHLASCAVLIAPAPPPAERVRLELGMSDTSIVDDPKDWSDVLAAIATRNRGRFVSMEVSGVLTAHAEHFILRDLAYDPIYKCVELRMTDTADGRCGLTRTIGHPSSIVVSRRPDGRERALEVVQDRGATLLLFLDDLTQL